MTKRHKDLSFSSDEITMYETLVFEKPFDHRNTIFIHPPKTSGTNLVLMANALAQTNIDFSAMRPAVARDKVDYPNLIFDGWLGGFWSLDKDAEKNHAAYKDAHFISGHFPFGLHEKALLDDFKYVAILRHPVDREISSLNFGYQRGYIEQEDWERFLFEDSIDNPQLRLLAGEQYMSGTVDKSVLDVAKENIKKHFAFVGVQERANDFFEAALSLLGGAPMACARAQITAVKLFDEAPEHVSARLKEKHALDIILYDWAVGNWAIWYAQNVKERRPISDQQKIIALPSDYAQTHQYIELSKEDIIVHNSKASGLVNLSQDHVELNSFQQPSGEIALSF